MSQIEMIKNEILEISLSELVNNKEKFLSMSVGTYKIIESSSPQCIFKYIPELKNNLVFIVEKTWNSHKFSLRKRRLYNDDQLQIKILIDQKPEVKLENTKGFYYHANTVSVKIDFGHGFSILEDGRYVNYSLLETSDDFLLSIGGTNFKFEEIFDPFPNNLNDAIRYIFNLSLIDKKLFIENSSIVNKILQYRGISRLEIKTKLEGITKTFSKIKEFYEKENDLFRSFSFYVLATSSNQTVENVKSSVIFNKLFQDVETEEDFYKICDKIRETHFFNQGEDSYFYLRLDSRSLITNLMNTLDDARDIKKNALKKKSTGAFNKIMNDLDFINIEKEKYPLTHELVNSGEIPLGTFFRKNGDSYFVYNDNWELWEAILKEYKDVAIQIANSCAGRTTYEKDIMSYFYFTLYELPEYLEKHTGKKWKGIPKLVNSADELEPPKAGESGTVKTRSALTPIVDNGKFEVTVPYVSMRIGGYQTTYCYGLNYSVLKRGFSYGGNTVTKEVEEKLNGRDDYGLMFYTLTGSHQGRGYPTFLIIFERLLKTTRVHFHRVHPMRSKGGDYNPVHNWTTGGYKWMIGNVNFERIKVQQGDLAFVEIDNFPEGESEKVNGYDNHMFETPVDYLPYSKKETQNILGYIKVEKKNVLKHTEHMSRTILPGVYEIRQCRSWEANPKGIWTLRID